MLPDPSKGKGLYSPFSGHMHSRLLHLQWPLITNVIETPALAKSLRWHDQMIPNPALCLEWLFSFSCGKTKESVSRKTVKPLRASTFAGQPLSRLQMKTIRIDFKILYGEVLSTGLTAAFSRPIFLPATQMIKLCSMTGPLFGTDSLQS